MATMISGTSSALESLTCRPRFATNRNPNRATLGNNVSRIAELIGTPLMPWQQFVADVALEINPDTGRLQYRTVVITVPRQSGKTTLLLSLMVHRAVGYGEKQNIVYTAQTQKAARKKWEEEHVEALNKSVFRGKYSVRYGMGTEQIHWTNGSRHGLTAPTEKAGHGETLDMGVIDEAFAQEDNRVEQALRPAMITRPQPQLYIISTAGNYKSHYLKDKVDLGRLMIQNNVQSSVAYFEWSALDDDDPADPDTWRRCMPALGHTIDIENIRSDFDAMKLPEFRRAYLNQWSDQIPELWLVITEQDWKSCQDTSSYITQDSPMAFGLDMTPERNFGTITVAGINAYDKVHLEITADEERGLFDWRPGTSWLVPRMVELYQRWNPCAVVVLKNSPAGSLIPELEAKGVKVVSPNSNQYAGACGALYDAVYAGKLAHMGQSPMTIGLANAMKFELGEGAWKWNRKQTTLDISPVVSMTLAAWGLHAHSAKETSSPWVGWI